MNKRKSTTKLHVNFQKDAVLAVLGTAGILICREAEIIEFAPYIPSIVIAVWGMIGICYNEMLIGKAEGRYEEERSKTIR